MAIVACKGTVLELEIAEVDTAIAQLMELDVGAQEPETFETRHLTSNAAVGRDPTGFFSQGPITFGLFYDPAAATHQFLASNSQAPGTKVDGQIVLVDGDTTELAFTAAAIGLGSLAIRGNDGLKMSSCTIITDGGVAYPTS